MEGAFSRSGMRSMVREGSKNFLIQEKTKGKSLDDIVQLLWSWIKFEPVVRDVKAENLIFKWDVTVCI